MNLITLSSVGIRQIKALVCGVMVMSVGTFAHGASIIYTEDAASPNGIVGESTLGGSTSTLVSGLDIPRGVAIDSLNSRIYYSQHSGIIAYSNFSGSSQTTVIASGAGNGTRGMAVDPAGGFIYWAAFIDNVINRAALDGSGQTTLISGLDTPASVSVDTVNSKLYWVERGTTLRIARSDLDGSNIETLVSSVDIDGGYLAVDPSHSFLFFDVRDGVGNTFIHRTDLDGSNGTNIATLSTASTSFEGITIDPENEVVYFGNSSGAGTISSIAYSGGSVSTVASGISNIHGLAFIPEPSTYALIISILSLAGVLWMRRKYLKVGDVK
tara:strand:+ start:978 stop:1955 length:978 start_codon:yes stop_codon:yes gene_type:complete